MKKVLYLFTLLFIGVNFSSCTPENIAEEVKEQACCGDDEEILPPPPENGGTGG